MKRRAFLNTLTKLARISDEAAAKAEKDARRQAKHEAREKARKKNLPKSQGPRKHRV